MPGPLVRQPQRNSLPLLRCALDPHSGRIRQRAVQKEKDVGAVGAPCRGTSEQSQFRADVCLQDLHVLVGVGVGKRGA